MTSAIVFPGMGPSVDVAKLVVVKAPDLLARASKVLGYSLLDRYRQASGDYNPHAQVMFVLACLAFTRSIEDSHVVAAAPSFGGRAAAAHCGVLSFDSTIWMTAQLATLMSTYFATAHPDIVTHSFVRIPADSLTPILEDLDSWHEISCYVDADFFMVSLHVSKLEWLKQRIAAHGGLSLYTMSPPMHASIFEDLRSQVDTEIFTQLSWSNPHIPIIADQDGTPRDTAEGVRTMLLNGITHPVNWPKVAATLSKSTITTLNFAGPDTMFSRVPVTTKNFKITRPTPQAPTMYQQA
jgi:[acyl-carrier-protein] S-malonyltransferase